MMVQQDRILRVVSAAVVALAIAIPSSAASGGNASAIRIYNFGQIDPSYYRGAQPKEHDYADLAAIGIKTVIDLQKDGEEDEPALVQRAGMKYVRIPMTTHEAPSPDNLAMFLSVVRDATNQPVYVHCREGRHRTGVMTAVYRMTTNRWTADQAFDEMKHYKFGSDFLHGALKKFVFAYALQLVPGQDAAPAAALSTVAAKSVPAAQR
jgi:tyrosine-protein phosphatase SIW14